SNVHVSMPTLPRGPVPASTTAGVTVGGTGGGCVALFGVDEDDDAAPSREQSEHPESASAARNDRRPSTPDVYSFSDGLGTLPVADRTISTSPGSFASCTRSICLMSARSAGGSPPRDFVASSTLRSR